MISFLCYLSFRNLSFKLIKYKIEAIIRTDIKIFNEDVVSKDKYFEDQAPLQINKKMQNRIMMDYLIGNKQFNHHLHSLEGKRFKNS